jgi:hypothetical protein
VKLPFLKAREKPGARCETCGRWFESVLREEPDAGGVVGLFSCPRCGTTYEAYRIDGTGLQIRVALEAATKRLDQGARDRLRKQLQPHVTKGRGRLPSESPGLTPKIPDG